MNQASVYKRLIESPEVGDSVSIRFERGESGLWFVTSDDLPGLLVAERTIEEACEHIVPCMRNLLKAMDFEQ